MSITAEKINGTIIEMQTPAIYDEFPELQKYRVQDLAIEQMKVEYLSLHIEDEEDKDNYKLVHKALADVRGKRVQVEKKRVELKADALKYGRAVDAEAKRIFELMEPIETHLKSEKDRIDSMEAERKAEKERLEKERMDNRISKLVDVGMLFNPVTQMYSFNSVGISHIELTVMNDEEFNNLYTKVSDMFDENRKAVAAQLKKEQEEAAEKMKEFERLQAQKAEQDKKEQELREKEEVIRKQLLQSRVRQLVALGMMSDGTHFKFPGVNGSIISNDEVANITEQLWQNYIESVTPEIEKVKLEIQQERIKAEQEREAKIKADAIEQEQKKEKARLEKIEADRKAKEEKERIKQAQAPDKEKLQKFLVDLRAVNVPAMKSAAGEKIFMSWYEGHTTLLGILEEEINKL